MEDALNLVDTERICTSPTIVAGVATGVVDLAGVADRSPCIFHIGGGSPELFKIGASGFDSPPDLSLEFAGAMKFAGASQIGGVADLNSAMSE
ncbi:hypothetical protein LIER_20007 [Lithospermum erythrorhizon]|uniref:Uncharacterized protein n=1 Tax=Lithospermum erythrorhizon TaxID=34254 RepID=A0AAV3QMW7_LITER